MQERQAEALRGFSDTIAHGRELAVAYAIRARLAEREPVAYTLSPLAEALLSQTPASPHPEGHPGRGLVTRMAQRLCDLVDETLYGDLLAIGRAHEAAIDQINGGTARS
jgi:hypothetical protein